MEMASEQRTGMIVSAVGHGALLLWALIGGFFNAPDNSATVITSEVSLMSSEEFAALQAAAPKATTKSPDAPSMPRAGSEAPPEPPKPEPKPEPKPAAKPEPQSQPDPAPDVVEATPPEAQVSDTPPPPITAPVDEPTARLSPTLSEKPKPKAAPRVAPEPTEPPPPDATVADQATPQQAPDEAAKPDQPIEEPKQATAPPESGEVLRTEENKDNVPASSAPVASARPKQKPAKPAPAPEQAAPAETNVAKTAEQTGADQAGIDSALADAMAGQEAEQASPGTGVADSGPPMTSGEKDALVLAVKACWNVGALSTDALHTVVTVGVTMGQDGRPDAGSIRLLDASGGDDTSTRQAFEAGRRAIIRCTKNGYPLPPEKYGQWREIEVVFDPSQMRMK